MCSMRNHVMNTSPSQYAIIFACVLCAIMFNITLCSFNVRYNKKDKHALLNFKQGDKDPSGVLSSWSTVEDCCEWRGVKCDNITSRVTELSLSCFTNLPNYSGKEDKSHCLTGPNLPAWLYTQRSLESLTIYESSFEAQDKFWNLVSRVPELYLEDNSIYGNLSNVSPLLYDHKMLNGRNNLLFLDIS
ncbi:hypothetical protein AAZV13_17G190400 [Glycine max]